MKKYAWGLFLLLSWSVFAQPEPEPDAVYHVRSSINQWQRQSYDENGYLITSISGNFVNSISGTKEVITITVSEEPITKDSYLEVIFEGVCQPPDFLLDVYELPSYLKGVKEVRVLNKKGNAGYVFENPRSSCNELDTVTDVYDRAIYNESILSHTHDYINR